MQRIQTIATVILLAAAIGCGGGTSVDNAWKDPTAQKPLGNILIVGISDNQTSRRRYEDTFASTLTAHGNVATQSNPIIPSGREADKVAITAMVTEKSFDGILTARAVSTDKEPLAPLSEKGGITPPNHYYSYWDFYSTAASAVSAPGYYGTESATQIESNLYDASGKLVWSGRSESFKYSEMGKSLVASCESLTGRLEKAGLIK